MAAGRVERGASRERDGWGRGSIDCGRGILWLRRLHGDGDGGGIGEARDGGSTITGGEAQNIGSRRRKRCRGCQDSGTGRKGDRARTTILTPLKEIGRASCR